MEKGLAAACAACAALAISCVCFGCSSAEESDAPADPSTAGAAAQESPAMDETGSFYLISADQAKSMMTSDTVVILDVRTQEEYDASHIVNAKLLPHDGITEETAAQVAPDKDEPVLVYCRTGGRSAFACASLASLGYTQVYDFGGIEDWPYPTIDAESDDGATVENDQAPVGVKIVCGQPTRSVPETD